ncbi:MAG TPA: 2-oxoglutarate dehydrogenase E1 component [Vicinamibacterales bacterium]
MSEWRAVGGINEGYLIELYERYLADPASVDPATRAAFERYGPPAGLAQAMAAAPAAAPANLRAVVGVVNLAECIRRFGHLAARQDPLGSEPIGDPSLEPETHGLTEADLRALPADLVGGPLAASAANAWEAIEALRRVYCSSIGFDLAHIFVPEERDWLRHHIEAGTFRPPKAPIDGVDLLDRITEVETFERFLHRTFPGKTRFSIEGLDMMVPVLDELIADSAHAGVRHVLIGMAHRGRLNVLAHVMQKSYTQILAEFKDALGDQPFREDLGWTGDVKYHAGARARVREDGSAPEVVITMPPNPSHLEFVNPVVVGMARAACTKADEPGPPAVDRDITLPILIHGDAAFPGQGIVAETLNLSRLRLYDVGGVIHVIANNQLGFTATGSQSYSTSYASGMARGFKMPIFHVNADDPEACLEVARLAAAFRAKFRRDTLIDLIGYRRHGHNEGDEPSFTQPKMYRIIAEHPTVREIWARKLIARGEIDQAAADALVQKYMDVLTKAFEGVQQNAEPQVVYPEPPPRGAARQAKTGVPLDRLQALNADLTRIPDGFTIHRKLERTRERRRTILDNPAERSVDWAAAEDLAFASILADGIPIRLTGEDVERGTFSHRHAVMHDFNTGARDIPLQRLSLAKASFEIGNTPLTECATLGFELGYNLQAPGRLVIWEAQYGDFVNGAQVIIDEFLVSGRAKWGLLPSLVLLLPHGFEGQGPDHSSARVERFLEAAADINLRVANCTTAAQYFHLLRRQAVLLTTDPLPLIVLTPKSLLRHPLVASRPVDLVEGRWYPVIGDEDAETRAAKIRRLILCSGKVYVDLVTSPLREQHPEIAIARLEQLYPFPWSDVQAQLDLYPALEEVVWVQEEPENMGAWTFVRPLLEELLVDRLPLAYVGRARSASPAEGTSAWHAVNQRLLIEEAFGPVERRRSTHMVMSRKV